jgi:hypothetical protein
MVRDLYRLWHFSRITAVRREHEWRNRSSSGSIG